MTKINWATILAYTVILGPMAILTCFIIAGCIMAILGD